MQQSIRALLLFITLFLINMFNTWDPSFTKLQSVSQLELKENHANGIPGIEKRTEE